MLIFFCNIKHSYKNECIYIRTPTQNLIIVYLRPNCVFVDHIIYWIIEHSTAAKHFYEGILRILCIIIILLAHSVERQQYRDLHYWIINQSQVH